MKAGDLVRFQKYSHHDDWCIGLLLEYHTWEKIGTVLHNGEIYRLRAENIQKAGKKDATDNSR